MLNIFPVNIHYNTADVNNISEYLPAEMDLMDINNQENRLPDDMASFYLFYYFFPFHFEDYYCLNYCLYTNIQKYLCALLKVTKYIGVFLCPLFFFLLVSIKLCATSGCLLLLLLFFATCVGFFYVIK